MLETIIRNNFNKVTCAFISKQFSVFNKIVVQLFFKLTMNI